MKNSMIINSLLTRVRNAKYKQIHTQKSFTGVAVSLEAEGGEKVTCHENPWQGRASGGMTGGTRITWSLDDTPISKAKLKKYLS